MIVRMSGLIHVHVRYSPREEVVKPLNIDPYLYISYILFKHIAGIWPCLLSLYLPLGTHRFSGR